MAEAVQWRSEAFAGEVEELERLRFTRSEISLLMKKRIELEYKINGPYKNLTDIEECIQYEKFYLKKILLRRAKHKLETGRHKLEHKIINRIKSFYELGLHRNMQNYAFALSFFKFCKQYKYFDVATVHINKMTEMFPHMPEVWRIAAEWKLKTDKKEAQRILNKGLQLHKTNTDLYSDAIDLVLAQDESYRKSDDKYNPELSCKELEIYVEYIFQNISDYTYYIKVLRQLGPHSFTRDVQDLIIDKLKVKFSHEPLIYQAIADQELNGYHYKLPVSDKQSFKFCLKRCFAVYEDGLNRVPSEKQPELWRYYIEALIDAQKQKPHVATKLKLDTFKNVLERAGNVIELEEKHFAAWIEFFVEDPEEVKLVLEKATAMVPNSLALWELRIKYAIMTDSPDVNKLFKRAILTLKEKATPIWLMMVNYHMLHSSPNLVHNIFHDGIKAPEPICQTIKPEYIQWLALTDGINEARRVYFELAERKPFCKELHCMMAKLESMESPGFGQNFNEWGKCLQLACKQFGAEDVEVWINYIKFYKYQHKSFDANERILQIYKEACVALPDILLTEFKEKFENLE